jgi:hypothetical protein
MDGRRAFAWPMMHRWRRSGVAWRAGGERQRMRIRQTPDRGGELAGVLRLGEEQAGPGPPPLDCLARPQHARLHQQVRRREREVRRAGVRAPQAQRRALLRRLPQRRARDARTAQQRARLQQREEEGQAGVGALLERLRRLCAVCRPPRPRAAAREPECEHAEEERSRLRRRVRACERVPRDEPEEYQEAAVLLRREGDAQVAQRRAAAKDLLGQQHMHGFGLLPAPHDLFSLRSPSQIVMSVPPPTVRANSPRFRPPREFLTLELLLVRVGGPLVDFVRRVLALFGLRALARATMTRATRDLPRARR